MNDSDGEIPNLSASVPPGPDAGMRCLGLLITGHRLLTESEIKDLRRTYVFYQTSGLAMVLIVPVLAICLILKLSFSIALTSREFEGDLVGILVIAFYLELFALLGAFGTVEKPLGRAIATRRDLHAGIVECCEGVIKPKKKQPEEYCFGQMDFMDDAGLSLMQDTNEAQTLERLPASGRLWTANGVRVNSWVEVRRISDLTPKFLWR